MSPSARLKELKNLAVQMVEYARSCGADEVEVGIGDGREFSVDVRLGEIENLVEASSTHLAIKIIRDKRTAYATTSDLHPDTVRSLIRNAVARAELGNRDECAGLPAEAKASLPVGNLNLYDPEVARFETRKKIKLALETERIALADKRITNSHGASFDTSVGTAILANSNGFLGSYDQTFCNLSIGLQAGETDEKAEDYWFTVDRFLGKLDPPETVARRAVERTVRHLHPKKIPTQTAPVIFEPPMTAWLVGFVFACISGVSVYQKASFLADRLGEKVGNGLVTIIDDGLMPGKLGSRPFDGEGVPCRQTTVIEKGVLRRFLCNTYAARKLKLQSTGNADGGGVGPNNFYLVPGSESPKKIIASTEKGLLLTRTLGHGLNPVTGDFSRGAFGLWVEKGEIAYPVSEITIAGNLEDVLNNIEIVGTDIDWRSAVCGPTIKVSGLTLAGE